LIAVVVLPTPPFWLAIAKMRGGPGGVAMGSGPGVVVDTGDMADPEDAGAWRRLAGDARHLHVPLCRRRRQFGLDHNPLEEEANAAGGKKWGGQGKQMGQGGKGTGRDQRRRDKTCGLGADCVYTNGRLGGASGFAQEGCLALIGLDQVERDISGDREYQAGKSSAGSKIDRARDSGRYQRNELQ